ncbi:serine/threonine-protein phosphatase 6 regulatory ankyrin repeat subunit A-like isoform X2 [Ceratina calcarata]|uniref:Serine/threonine-protein phosphatase 6 regulatory ankyrin repeat subunit A-like isoform X2 n=1 Tax=Ceratina calcarata TaxID=156304 RepID=A0AAJ7J687_9HYME|nr:serine/threonine-protein phosphatase 6 regulatory ankyrin repeat subunit A-like isoform X2 [Ceratina calcarata]
MGISLKRKGDLSIMNIQDLRDAFPLLQAIFFGDVYEVRALLSKEEDAKWQDKEKRSLLHAAAYKGDPAIVEALLLNGAIASAKDTKWLTPLHRACCSGNHRVVEVLLRHKAVNSRDRNWQTPLHVAVANNAMKCVELLVPHVININVADRAGRTSLHHATYNGHLEMIEYLIQVGCAINVSDKKDRRPLHFAAYMGHDIIVRALIDKGADVDVKDRDLYTPLHAAAASGNIDCMDILMNSGADIEAKNVYGNTPLHIACLNGHADAVIQLIAKGANVEAVNYREQTPLHLAAASTHGVDCLEVLLQNNVRINVQSEGGRTPLYMSAIHGRFTRSKSLLDAGAPPDVEDKNGNTALHVAAWFGHECLTTTLLEYGASPAARNTEHRTPLHLSCLAGHIEVCRKLLQADSRRIDSKDIGGWTPLHCAAFKGSVDCLDLLLSSGANFRLTDNDNRLALHYAASQDHYLCVFTLIGFGSDANAQDIDGATPLHLAAAAKPTDTNTSCVQYLLKHKADPHLRDKRNFTTIHYAVAGGNQLALKALLEVCPPEQLTVSSTGKPEPPLPALTPLHLAAYYGHSEILSLLMPFCTIFSNNDMRDETGKTPLDLAAYKGHEECVDVLLKYDGVRVSVQDFITRRTPVHCAAAGGHRECLSLLLRNAEDPNVINYYDSKQRTPLMLATANNHVFCVLMLLKHKADCNLPDMNKHTPLFRAVIWQQHKPIDFLILHGAQVAIQDIYGKTPLHLAAACGKVKALCLLVNNDPAAAAIKDNQGCTVLHWACYNGHADCVEYLLEQNVIESLEGNPFSAVHCAVYQGSAQCLELLINKFGGKTVAALKDVPGGRLPLHVAASSGSVDCARLILSSVGSELAGLETPDNSGRTPLLFAAITGQCSAIELLLEWKANVRAVDCNKNTALHLACERSHSAAASLLLNWIDTLNNDHDEQERIAIINMTNDQQRTPLHLAARNGLVTVTRRLLQLGASVVAVDAEGLTPALACAPNPAVARCLATILAAHDVGGVLESSIQQTSEVYLNGKGRGSQHSSDTEFY